MTISADERMEALERRLLRRHAIMAVGVGAGTLGMGASAVLDAFAVTGAPSMTASLVGLAGYLVFALGLFANSSINDKELLVATIDDERVRAIRGQATTWGFGAILLAQVAIMLAVPILQRTAGVTLDAADLAGFSVGVATFAAFFRFVQLSR